MAVERDPASFRDPSGYILRYAGQIFRSVDLTSFCSIQSFLRTASFDDLVQRGVLIGTEVADAATSQAIARAEQTDDRHYLKHEQLWVVTYPQEWCPEMLVDAGLCTLDVQLALLADGLSLKDASAYNVQWAVDSAGPRPLFIDVASIEPIQDASGIWVPYKQFSSQFLLPLLLYRTLGLDYRGVFLSELDGLDPETAYRMLSLPRKLLPPFLTTVTLPHLLRKLERRRPPRVAQGDEAAPSEVAKEKARYLLRHTASSLRRKIRRASRTNAGSEWADYEQSRSYTAEARVEKDDFVRKICEQISPRFALDIGANTGRFSFMAADAGAKVVAVDTDMAALDHLYRRAQSSGASVLPLRVDIANPTPAIGWANRERPSFLDRMPTFDCVLALAVVHHLMAANGVPLESIVELTHSLTTRYVIMELVDVSDPMYQRLLRGRDAPSHLRLGLAEQEAIVSKHFDLRETVALSGMDRRVYLLEKR